MKLYINNQQIKHTSLSWNGSKYNAARQITVTYPANLIYKFSQGHSVVFKDDSNNELFRGYVFRKERAYSSDEVTVIAYDALVYLLKSNGSFNYKSIAIGEYVKKIAANVGISVGSLVDSNVQIKMDPQTNIGLYQAILDGYKLVKNQTGKVYIPQIINNKLSVTAAGEIVKGLELSNGKNLLDTTYTETIENVINKVIIVDDKGKKIGQVTGEGLTSWGTFQDVYQIGDKKTPTTEAKKILHGLDQEATVQAIGDVRCISGKAITIKDPIIGLRGLFYIGEDTHTWENNNHTMNLTLNFKNIMEDSL